MVMTKKLKELVLKIDHKVTFSKGEVMKKKGHIFKQDSLFKYGIVSNKQFISFHLMPMYANPDLKKLYEDKMPKCKFNKGCINLNPELEINWSTLKDLIRDCSKKPWPCK